MTQETRLFLYISRCTFPASKISGRGEGDEQMAVQFLLFIISVLLFSIFWELSKINDHLRKALHPSSEVPFERSRKEQVASERG